MSDYQRHTTLDSIDKTGLYRLAMYLVVGLIVVAVAVATWNDYQRTVVMDRCIQSGNDPLECREAAHG